jgi:cytoskeletal protein RodZ
MAKGTFGERLKRERELREVKLAEVSAATRISERFLQALENEDWSRLPGGIFGRGFVRTIARYLGLDEENLLAEYDLARTESAAPVASKPDEPIPSPPKWIPVLLAVGVLALLAVVVYGGIYAWRRYAAHRAAKPSSFYSPRSGMPEISVSSMLLELNGTPRLFRGEAGSSGRMVLSWRVLEPTNRGSTQR